MSQASHAVRFCIVLASHVWLSLKKRVNSKRPVSPNNRKESPLIHARRSKNYKTTSYPYKLSIESGFTVEGSIHCLAIGNKELKMLAGFI